MRRIVAALIAAAFILSACDENEQATIDFAFDLLNASGGKIDAKDPAKTLQNTMSGETIGNAAQEPALGTARSIQAQEALDDADSAAQNVRLAGPKASDVDRQRAVAKYDSAIERVPDGRGYAYQRAEAHRGRGGMYELWAISARDGGGDQPQASRSFGLAGSDYAQAGHADPRPDVRGNAYADAARAYYAGGHEKKACEFAHLALQSKPDRTRAATANRILDSLRTC